MSGLLCLEPELSKEDAARLEKAARNIDIILVMLPRTYPTGKDEPASVKRAFLKARRFKYRLLLWGTLSFIAGLLAAVFLLTT